MTERNAHQRRYAVRVGGDCDAELGRCRLRGDREQLAQGGVEWFADGEEEPAG